MRLLTLNTWKNEGPYPERLQSIAALLQEEAADVVFLQEVFQAADGSSDTGAWLASATGLRHVFAPARPAIRRWPDGRRCPSVSGLSILTKWPLTDIEVLPLPTSAEGGERIALLAALKTDKGMLTVANVHLSHLRGDSIGRSHQLEVLLSSARWQKPAAARVCAGDFNAPPESPEMRGLLAKTSLSVSDTWVLAEAGPYQGTCPCPAKVERTPRKIDYILSIAPVGTPHPHWQNARVVEKATGSETYPSDHVAVVAELVL